MANYRSCTSKEKAVYPQGRRGGGDWSAQSTKNKVNWYKMLGGVKLATG